jgi:hypothetical protein
VLNSCKNHEIKLFTRRIHDETDPGNIGDHSLYEYEFLFPPTLYTAIYPLDLNYGVPSVVETKSFTLLIVKYIFTRLCSSSLTTSSSEVPKPNRLLTECHSELALGGFDSNNLYVTLE